MEKLLKPPRFDLEPSASTADQDWTHWRTTFENFTAVVPDVTDEVADACKRCCRMNLNETCFPVTPHNLLPDGTPCIHGFCNHGVCEKTIQDVVERFWDIIEDININKVLLILRDNVVGAVIIVTALIWVPASCLINYLDKKRLEKRYEPDSDYTRFGTKSREDLWMAPDQAKKVINIKVPKPPNPQAAM